MEIYERDYRLLTEAEKEQWEVLKAKKVINSGEMEFRKSLYSQYPIAVRHYLSLFPNNHLDIFPIWNGSESFLTIEKFEKFLEEESTGEREVLNFIRNEKAYPMIASILDHYNFGHHDAFIFPEFPLGNSFRADYLIIGQSSDGFQFIFVELESVNNRITLENGDFGESIRKGLSQINDWDYWLDENFHSLSEIFSRLKGDDISLPNEFYKLDKSRIHYAIIVGRRKHYNDKTYRLRRNEKDDRKIMIVHYDNIIDLSKKVIDKNTY